MPPEVDFHVPPVVQKRAWENWAVSKDMRTSKCSRSTKLPWIIECQHQVYTPAKKKNTLNWVSAVSQPSMASSLAPGDQARIK